MKIYIDNIIFELQLAGGISAYFSELGGRLLASNENVSFIGRRSSNENIFLEALDIPDERIVPERRIPLSFRRYLSIQADVEGPCIMHSSYYRIVRGKEVAMVVSVYDFNYEKLMGGVPKWVHSWQKRRAVENADGIVCISENTRNDLFDFYENIDPTKVKVIYLAGSSEFFSLGAGWDPGDGHEDLRRIIDSKYVLVVGSRKHHKNFGLAVEVTRRFPHLRLVIVGGGELLKAERELLEEKLHQRYTHLGSIPTKRLNLLYNHAFCLLYPSSYEGFGIPILEAMQAGCPVVTTNISSIPEVGGKAAVLARRVDVVEFEACARQLENERFRQRMIEAGFEQARRFSWEKTVRETLEFYREVYERRFGETPLG